MIGKPPKIVIPGMNRGAGIPDGVVLGRRRGVKQGPVELLDLKHLTALGLATTAENTKAQSGTASTAQSSTDSLSKSVSTSLSQISSSLSGTNSTVTSLSFAVSTVISGSISAVNSAISSLSTAVGAGGGVDDDSALSTSLSSAVSINTTQSTSLSQISSSLSGAISSTSSLSVAVSTTDSSNLSTAEAYTDAAVAAIAGGGTGTPANGVVSGLGVSYVSGLTFAMTAGSANINGVLVTASAQTTTLATADATNPRIDVLYVDDTGTFGHITGTPSTNPSQPTVDPTSQLYLAFALVPATATSLSGFTTETIYDEGSAGEWTGSTSGSGFTIGSTNNPNTGTKDIEGTSVVAGAYAKFVDGTPTTFDGDGSLLLSIRSKATWNSKRSLVLQWFDAGVAKGVPVTLKEGSFGFSSSNISSYQALVIAKSLFAVPAGTIKDEFRITAAGSGGTFGFYIDPIKLQTVTSGSGGSGGGGTTTGITQDQADARYEQLSNFNSYSTVVSTTDRGQTVSLSQISSSLSGAISSTSSLSTAVSTVVSGSISTVNSRIDSLSTAVGTGGPDDDSALSTSLSNASTSLSQISSSLSSTNSTDVTQSTSLSQISSSLSGAISTTTSLSTAVSTAIEAISLVDLGIIHAYEEQPTGTAGGSSIAATWVGRILNITGTNTISSATLVNSTVTISLASPGVVTWNAHGLPAGAAVKLATTGALPTGLAIATQYYVVSPATNTFQLATTPGGTAINTSGSQSGTHTAYTEAVSLPAGTYDVEGTAPCYDDATFGSKIKFYNLTDGADIIAGTSDWVQTGNMERRCFVAGRFTLASTKYVSLRSYHQNTQATNGLGVNANFSVEANHFTNLTLARIH